MPDLAIAFSVGSKVLDLVPASADRPGNGLAEDADLFTSVLASLFTWRRANADDVLPDTDLQDRQGYWGDSFARTKGRKLGSRLWLLSRRILNAETVLLARTYAEEALAWMVKDGVAVRVDVTSERIGATTLALKVVIVRRDGTEAAYLFEDVWQQITGSAA